MNGFSFGFSKILKSEFLLKSQESDLGQKIRFKYFENFNPEVNTKGVITVTMVTISHPCEYYKTLPFASLCGDWIFTMQQ